MFESLQTHIIGTNTEFSRWTMDEWLGLALFLQLLVLYFSLYISTKLLNKILIFLSSSKICLLMISAPINFCRPIPYIGKYKKQLFHNTYRYFTNQVLPQMQLAVGIWEQLFNAVLFFYLFENQNNTQIIFPEGSDELRISKDSSLLTTLILANHRSIIDYALISFLVEKSVIGDNLNPTPLTLKGILNKKDKSCDILPAHLRFIGWGKVFKIIRLDIIKNFFFHHERQEINKRGISHVLRNHGNTILVIFPEVNIFNKESSLVQRKLNENLFPYVPKFYNLLYPRLKTFSEVMLGLQPYQKDPPNKTKTCDGTRSHSFNPFWQLSRFISQTLSNPTVSTDLSFPDVSHDNLVGNDVRLNSSIFDLNIVYYRLRRTRNGHDHDTGKTLVHNGIQLEQITPSLLGMVSHNMRKVSDPIFISVNIRKYSLPDIMQLKPPRMEKWLESHWCAKDAELTRNHNSVSLL